MRSQLNEIVGRFDVMKRSVRASATAEHGPLQWSNTEKSISEIARAVSLTYRLPRLTEALDSFTVKILEIPVSNLSACEAIATRGASNHTLGAGAELFEIGKDEVDVQQHTAKAASIAVVNCIQSKAQGSELAVCVNRALSNADLPVNTMLDNSLPLSGLIAGLEEFKRVITGQMDVANGSVRITVSVAVLSGFAWLGKKLFFIAGSLFLGPGGGVVLAPIGAAVGTKLGRWCTRLLLEKGLNTALASYSASLLTLFGEIDALALAAESREQKLLERYAREQKRILFDQKKSYTNELSGPVGRRQALSENLICVFRNALIRAETDARREPTMLQRALFALCPLWRSEFQARNVDIVSSIQTVQTELKGTTDIEDAMAVVSDFLRNQPIDDLELLSELQRYAEYQRELSEAATMAVTRYNTELRNRIAALQVELTEEALAAKAECLKTLRSTYDKWVAAKAQVEESKGLANAKVSLPAIPAFSILG